jgi:DNA polymerase-3 subunit beta
MRITILQENLQKAILLASHFVANKIQLPILENILLQANKTTLSFSATNLESSIVIQQAAKIEKEGKICLPAKTLQEIVPSLSQDKVLIEQNQEKISLKCGRTFVEIKGVDATEFPAIPQAGKQDCVWVIKGKDLEKICSQVAFAAAADESRPVLAGVRIKAFKKGVELVATDGYRLSKKNIGGEPRKEEEMFVVPAKIMLEAARILAKEAEKVSFCFEKKQNQLIISSGDIYIVSRLIDGEFPPFSKIVPSSFQTTVSVDREEMVRALKIASVFSRESSNIVRFKAQDSKIKISANAPLVGENESEIDAKIEGEEVEIAFNFRFVLELLNAIEQDQIKIKFNGSLSPAVFEPVGDKNFFHLIMPVRLQTPTP